MAAAVGGVSGSLLTRTVDCDDRHHRAATSGVGNGVVTCRPARGVAVKHVEWRGGVKMKGMMSGIDHQRASRRSVSAESAIADGRVGGGEGVRGRRSSFSLSQRDCRCVFRQRLGTGRSGSISFDIRETLVLDCRLEMAAFSHSPALTSSLGTWGWGWGWEWFPPFSSWESGSGSESRHCSSNGSQGMPPGGGRRMRKRSGNNKDHHRQWFCPSWWWVDEKKRNQDLIVVAQGASMDGMPKPSDQRVAGRASLAGTRGSDDHNEPLMCQLQSADEADFADALAASADSKGNGAHGTIGSRTAASQWDSVSALRARGRPSDKEGREQADGVLTKPPQAILMPFGDGNDFTMATNNLPWRVRKKVPKKTKSMIIKLNSQVPLSDFIYPHSSSTPIPPPPHSSSPPAFSSLSARPSPPSPHPSIVLSKRREKSPKKLIRKGNLIIQLPISEEDAEDLYQEQSARTKNSLHHGQGPMNSSSSSSSSSLRSGMTMVVKRSDLRLGEQSVMGKKVTSRGKHDNNGWDSDEEEEEAEEEAELRLGSVKAKPSSGLMEEVWSRGRWLLGLLVLQSSSSFVLQYYTELIEKHLVITLFLTMLVGAGGNAGNQSAIKVIRELATHRIQPTFANLRHCLKEQLTVGFLLAVALSGLAFLRVLVSGYGITNSIAISISLFVIVLTSVVVGSTLPFFLAWGGFDPANAGTTVQVIMDILGVTVTCAVCNCLFNLLAHSPLEQSVAGVAGTVFDAVHSAAFVGPWK